MAKKILIIDDEPDYLELMTIRMQTMGYEVLAALSAEAAMEMMATTTPDLILLDLVLPGIQGNEFCIKLRAAPALKKIPIIVFTASSARVPKYAADIGADDCLEKPFEPAHLAEKIKKMLGHTLGGKDAKENSCCR